jgi:collagenase-like PrtC family protease
MDATHEPTLLPLDVPFLPDADYCRLVRNLGDRIASVHFSLFEPSIPDARHASDRLSVDALLGWLASLPGVRRLALLNSRFHAPESYSPETLAELVSRLKRLAGAGVLDGIVYADVYLLFALAEADPELCARLEAVPSVNACIDAADKAFSHFDAIRASGFRQPGRLVLDRSLNRRLPELRRTVAALRQARPRLSIVLMANEGCLYQCPFKPAHDAHMAHARFDSESPSSGDGFSRNVRLGCQRMFHADPGRLLASPFIRPEDQSAYAGLADVLKLCGRSRGPGVMRRIVEAYARGSFAGNLLLLMDSMEPLAGVMRLPNEDIPADFLRRVTTCVKNCTDCGWCGDLAESLLTHTGPGIPSME